MRSGRIAKAVARQSAIVAIIPHHWQKVSVDSKVIKGSNEANASCSTEITQESAVHWLKPDWDMGWKAEDWGTYIERHCCFSSITCSSTTPWLKIRHRVSYRMYNGLQSSHSRSPTMQGQESRLTPSSYSNQNIISTCKQDGNTHVHQTESARPIPDVLAHFKLRRCEPGIGREIAERNGRENHVHNNVDADEDTERPSRYVANVSRKRFETPRPE